MGTVAQPGGGCLCGSPNHSQGLREPDVPSRQRDFPLAQKNHHLSISFIQQKAVYQAPGRALQGSGSVNRHQNE